MTQQQQALAEYVKSQRESRGWTLDILSAYMGRHRNYMSQAEKTGKMTMEMADQLACVLDLGLKGNQEFFYIYNQAHPEPELHPRKNADHSRNGGNRYGNRIEL